MATKNRSFDQRVLDALVELDANRINQPRIVRMANRFKAAESVNYTEWDLRGLSQREKDFLRENGMKCYVDLYQEGYKWNYKKGYHKNRYYIFIARDLTTGRKRLYAYHKTQWMNYNGRQLNDHNWDYECWLIVNLKDDGVDIDRFHYERRFSRILAPVAIY